MSVIIAGASNKALAQKVADFSGMQYIDALTSKFADGELQVNIKGKISGKVFILQSLSPPINDHLIELLLIADAVHRSSSSSKITAIIPYLGYSRQDKIGKDPQLLTPLASNVTALIIEAVKIDQLITIDLHSPQIIDFFKIPVHNLMPLNLFVFINQEIIENNDTILVAPDEGSIDKIGVLSKQLKLKIAYIQKHRSAPNICNSTGITGDVGGKNCILVDDIVDTGGTLIQAAQLLKAHGALNIICFITHAILSKNAIELLKQAPIDKIYITDTISINKLPSKFQIISESSTIASLIKKLLN